ncbi:hypothetical protein TWF694_005541 [Orbilia ellipsospora]|uniref:Peptidase S53 domain-containing protein n=1 Tax=Orbilia ellipsospora TaxID=2528407 RepID=A0AAV9WVV3_9PEZI
MYAQLGARGVSVLVASGDNGFGYYCKQYKKTTGRLGFGYKHVIRWSGNGLSNVFDRPIYQAADKNYLQVTGATDTANNQGLFNRPDRAYPDVPALGDDFLEYVNLNGGQFDTGRSRTSASTPIFASVITLLNGIRIRQGQKPLGFLNPWLYKSIAPSQGLNDITTGKTHAGCPNIPSLKDNGWNATQGWDLGGGLGTPNFRVMAALMNSSRNCIWLFGM